MRPLFTQPGAVLQSNYPGPYRRNRARASVAGLVLIAVAGCGGEAPRESAVTWVCDPDARLVTELFGAVNVRLDWSASEMRCDGMPRPDGEGARIRLSGRVGDEPDANTVAFIFGIPTLEMGATEKELGTNVTFMEEGTGRFFGTRDADGCWSDIDVHDAVPDANGSTFRIGGTVYCVSPLAELNGASSISFTELEFVARLNWDDPE